MLGAGAAAGAVRWLRTWRRQVAGAGAGAARGGERLPVLVLGAGAGVGAGAVSWLCTWWRQVAGAGAGRRAPVLALVLYAGCARGGDSGRRCFELAGHSAPALGAGCACGGDRAPGAGRRAGGGRWCWVLGIPALGAGAGRRELARRCSALVPASDSEVITAATSDTEG